MDNNARQRETNTEESDPENRNQKQKAQDWWTEDREDRYDEFVNIREKAEEQYRESIAGYVTTSHTLIHPSVPNPHGIGADETPDEWCFSGAKNRIHDPDLMVEILENITGKSVRWETEGWEYSGFYFLLSDE